MKEEYYSPAEIAAILKIKTATVYRHIKTGKLQAIKIGNRYRVSAKQFDAYLHRNTVGGSTESEVYVKEGGGV